MAVAKSKITKQGQITVPATIREKLGIAPGSTLEWHEAGGEIVVRRAAHYSSEDIHAALFPSAPSPRTTDEMKDGIRARMRRKYTPADQAENS